MMSNNLLTSEPNDDTIHCLFFLSKNDCLEEYCNQINNTIKSLTEGYIWHQEELQVFIPLHEDCNDTAPTNSFQYICSTTCFGDNIEDEWYIVHLILEISKQYPDLIIQVKDCDGDFLLIEAADYLPAWANPGSTENRVFIHNNHIHFITAEHVSLSTKLELNEALYIIQKKPQLTQAPENIEQAIRNRIGKYPDKMSENIHRSAVTLPSQLACLLILKPSLIAPLVDTYCSHDAIDAKCCKNIEFDDCVTVEVKFTKFLYAKLLHSKLIQSVQHYTRSHMDKKSDLGLKLTCGFQMIKHKASATDIFSSKEYLKFVESLQQNGYFRDNIEGSKEYNQLLEKAKEYFSTLVSPFTSQVSLMISKLMSSSDYETVKLELKDKYVVPSNYTGDKEDWLNIHADHLNDLLNTRYGQETKIKNNDLISSESVAKELSSFLKQTSDFEGIEPRVNESTEDENIEFESDKFVGCLEKMLNMLSTGNLNSNENSDDDDFDNDDIMEQAESNYYDDELKAKLQRDHTENTNSNGAILSNIRQSMKEEQASTGPSSNILHSIGIQKTKLLDSDDDD